MTSARISKLGKTLTIHLPEQFNYEFYSAFRASYVSNAPAEVYILDFSKTEHIDSSGLGMMLLLKDECKRSKIKIENCNESILNIFDIAKFQKLFKIPGL